jgi:hypothetical protein
MSAPATKSAILIGVDGTGATDDRAYARDMKDSFVNQIVRNSPIPVANKKYHRGPDWTGLGIKFTSASEGLGTKLIRPTALRAEIKQLLGQQPKGKGPCRIFLTGYSRGAAVVINTAALLKQDGIDVEALFLFDAVQRSFQLEAKLIPANVKHCYHAIRDPNTHSRDSFGNCGLSRADGRKLDGFEKFFTTHGGMGGTPWGQKGAGKDGFIHESFPDGATRVTPSAESQGMAKVHTWMWAFLRHHGVLS